MKKQFTSEIQPWRSINIMQDVNKIGHIFKGKVCLVIECNLVFLSMHKDVYPIGENYSNLGFEFLCTGKTSGHSQVWFSQTQPIENWVFQLWKISRNLIINTGSAVEIFEKEKNLFDGLIWLIFKIENWIIKMRSLAWSRGFWII